MKQKTKERPNPKPEVVREYLLNSAQNGKAYFIEQKMLLSGWSKKNGDLFLDIVVNYEQIIEQLDHIIRRLETPSNDKGLSKTNNEKKDR
ncbi:MAG: hypothetical protein M0Q91_13870 [Methanoregula sp.]|jgi:hypothetical protein|nr:hypothetical protein [Methanoregula sp.]